MARSSPRQVALLALLLAVLAVVLLYNMRSGQVPAAAGATRAGRPAAPGQEATAVEPVRLERLEADRPAPDEAARNLFRFGQREVAAANAPPPVPAADQPLSSAGPVVPAPPAGPAPPPVISLKFIGIVDPASSGALAVLSDGRNVFYGREGDTIEGRYRILHIGVESIEMSYLDGRGRQVIRLSGS
jgi:hypothetical protein